MLREACLVAFVVYDIGKRVINGRRKRRASADAPCLSLHGEPSQGWGHHSDQAVGCREGTGRACTAAGSEGACHSGTARHCETEWPPCGVCQPAAEQDGVPLSGLSSPHHLRHPIRQVLLLGLCMHKPGRSGPFTNGRVVACVAGTNIYFPQAWLAAACICCAVVIAQIAYLIVVHQVQHPLMMARGPQYYSWIKA